MAYFSNSTYPQNFDSYQYYDQYYSNNHGSYHEPNYVNHYSNTQFHENAYQHAPTPSSVGYYYSTYNQPQLFTSKNTNFQENGEYYYDPVSTEFVVSYNSTSGGKDEVVEEKEDEPKNFHGGYDITKHYGKPLPPSQEICHPISKNDPKTPSLSDVNFGSVPSPYLKDDKEVGNDGDSKKGDHGEVIDEGNYSDFESDEEYDDAEYDEDDDEEEEEKLGEIGALPTKEAQNLEGETKAKDKGIGDEVIQEMKALDLEGNDKGQGQLDEPKPKNESISEGIQEEKALELSKENEEFEDEDEYEDEVEGEGEIYVGNEGKREENYENQVRRQIPPGYGIEAFDICEGLFGGYFPCLWKRNQRIYNHQREVNVNEKISDYDYCWKETADYLFGNPNPYGGSMPEKGSYGDPIYSYQRHFPQQSVTHQVDYYGGNSSYLQNSR